jgi:hypothetical protein
VSIAKYSACIVAATLVAGCGTPEGNAWVGGVSPQEARDAGAAVRQKTSAQILSFERDRDDPRVIHVWTRGDEPAYPDRWSARRLGKTWKVTNDVMLY